MFICVDGTEVRDGKVESGRRSWWTWRVSVWVVVDNSGAMDDTLETI